MRNRQSNVITAILWNIALAYIVLFICRIIFIAVNIGMYSDSLQNNDLWQMFTGALRFDTSAVCYMNALYILCLLFPLHYKEGSISQCITKVAFVVCNSIGIIANLCDAVYVPFTGRRTTWSLFSEFSNEGNMGTVIGTEVINHWYLVVTGIVLIWLLYRLYLPAKIEKRLLHYYLYRIPTLFIAALLIVAGIRGGIGRTVRPISLNDANLYISAPSEAAIVLNTPFSMIRTIGKNPFHEVSFFKESELEAIFNPIKRYGAEPAEDDGQPAIGKREENIVIFIVESFGKEYIGAYNTDRNEPSLTPFLDSLISKSLTYKYSYGNGRKSIDGMPSVLSGIPMFVEPFFVTPASLNKVSGIAGELGKEGYHSAFFHGAPNGSMGFQAFAKATGFKEYYGMDEYNASPLHKDNSDFDGAWAIWDEPFFQFYAEEIGKLPQPFVAAMFSASSHHPFKIPTKYESIYKEGKLPIHKCIEYTDNALRLFFEKASKEEWFNNTLFIITADHSNQNIDPRYKSSSGFFEVPIIFYKPGNREPFAARMDSTLIAQQIDIMPTVLDYMGYDKEFLTFGKSLLQDTPQESYAVNYLSGQYQYFKGEYMLQFDGEKSTALFDVRHDPQHKVNLKGTKSIIEEEMERELKAIIQQYMYRMLNDKLTPDNE